MVTCPARGVLQRRALGALYVARRARFDLSNFSSEVNSVFIQESNIYSWWVVLSIKLYYTPSYSAMLKFPNADGNAAGQYKEMNRPA